MKQGKHYLSIVIWIFLAAIVAYFGYNLATSLYTPLRTTTAVEYEAGAGYYATGFVVQMCIRDRVSMFDLHTDALREALERVNVETLTPIEAMNVLYQLKQML